MVIHMWLFGFMGGASLPAALEGHRSCGLGDITFQIFHVNSQDCIVKELCDSMGSFLSPYVITLPSLVV